MYSTYIISSDFPYCTASASFKDHARLECASLRKSAPCTWRVFGREIDDCSDRLIDVSNSALPVAAIVHQWEPPFAAHTENEQRRRTGDLLQQPDSTE